MKGFTLIELVVVVSIVVLLAGVALVFGRRGEREIALVRAAERLAFDLERAKALALQTRSFAGVIPCGYGIYFSRLAGAASYILYVDTQEGSTPCSAGDVRRTGAAQDVEVVTLEQGVMITGLTPSSGEELYVVFAPPRPELKLFPAGTRAEIQLGLSGSASQTRVIVEASGEIRTE